VNIGLAFHGFYWILISYLIFRSTFLPRILGATTIAGLCWLTFLSPRLTNYLTPYNLASIDDALAPRDGRERSTMEGAGRRSGRTPMKAAVYTRYGPPDIVQITDVEKRVPKDNEVLIKVRAASVNPYDWHFMRGTPYGVRIAAGLRKPVNSNTSISAGTGQQRRSQAL
jgi:hypothetical protein